MSFHAVAGTVLAGVVSGAVYGLLWFLRKRRKNGREEEPFDMRKFGATLIVAAVIGGVTALSGDAVQFDSVAEQLAFYAGAVALVEAILKMVVQELRALA